MSQILGRVNRKFSLYGQFDGNQEGQQEPGTANGKVFLNPVEGRTFCVSKDRMVGSHDKPSLYGENRI